MSITIRELGFADAGAMSTLLPLFQAGTAAASPRQPEPSELFLTLLIRPRAAKHIRCLVADDGDRPAGFARMAHGNVANRDLVHGELWIGAGDRDAAAGPLVEACLAYAKDRGCARLILDNSEFSGHATALTAGGGRILARERRRQLDLTAVDRAQYAAWAAPTEKNAHYRVEIWQIPTPEDRLAALVEANDVMRDAPTGDFVLETPPPDLDRRRAAEADNIAAGTRMYVAAALTEDDEVAGFHEVLVFPDYRMADVGNTGVPAKFRGHALGLRLKSALALHLLEHEPHMDTLSTWNNADNAPMIRVNEAMGYEVAEVWEAWQFDL